MIYSLYWFSNAEQLNVFNFLERAVDCRKLKLQKLKEDKLNRWKEEKQKQKLVKKASEKPAFKCGIVHHKVGSPYLNDISNMNYKKMSIPAKREGQKFTQESCTLNMDLHTYSKEQSFAPPNFRFKVFL
jgi:hypothetical protein